MERARRCERKRMMSVGIGSSDEEIEGVGEE